MTSPTKTNDILSIAKRTIPGFENAYNKFIETTTIRQSSRGLIYNYGRSLVRIALHFNKLPHHISVDQINTYLYQIMLNNQYSITYFKHAVYGLRYWFRLFNMEDKAVLMPPIKKRVALPVVLSTGECKELFKAPSYLKHRFLLAFAYAGGLRMNELRLIKITDVDVQRGQVHLRHGKGRKQRYVALSKLIAAKLSLYLTEIKPLTYLFEGRIPGKPMGQRSIQYIIRQALIKTTIQKSVSMHTLRHSYATHLLEQGIDINTIQLSLGHSQITTTLSYLHVAQIKSKMIHSPLDTLYGFL
jgi:integrase/recombinase XerD